MGILDFFKQKKENYQPENIDEIFDLASKDVSYKPLFYRTVLEMKLYLLIKPNNNLPRGKFTSDENTQLEVKVWSNGKVPIFTDIKKIFDNDIITDDQRWIAVTGRDAFKMFNEPTTFILNPFSFPRKEFLPDEISRLLSGEPFTKYEERTMKSGDTITFGIPADYPFFMAETLKKYCNTRKEVNNAYLALMYNSTSGEKPSLIIGLDLTSNFKEIYKEIGDTLKIHVKNNEPIDVIDISSNSAASKALKQKQFQIY